MAGDFFDSPGILPFAAAAVASAAADLAKFREIEKSPNDISEMGQDSTFFRGILDKMQSKGLQVLEAQGLHLIKRSRGKGGDLTLYPSFAGSETGASWEYCFSSYPPVCHQQG